MVFGQSSLHMPAGANPFLQCGNRWQQQQTSTQVRFYQYHDVNFWFERKDVFIPSTYVKGLYASKPIILQCKGYIYVSVCMRTSGCEKDTRRVTDQQTWEFWSKDNQFASTLEAHIHSAVTHTNTFLSLWWITCNIPRTFNLLNFFDPHHTITQRKLFYVLYYELLPSELMFVKIYIYILPLSFLSVF